jgi:hypothetical protein
MGKLFIIGFLLISGVPVFADEPKKSEPEIVCSGNVEIEKALNEKGFIHLLDMNNDSSLTQSLWIGGRIIIATAQKGKDESCIVASFSEVTLNPFTFEAIVNQLHKGQKKL